MRWARPGILLKWQTKGANMSGLEIILIVIAFVIPAICILADNGSWERKKN